MKWFRGFLIFMTVLFTALALFAFKTYRDAGELRELSFHVPRKIITVKGLLGSEDLTLDRGAGLALISSAEMRLTDPDAPRPRGAIMAYDLVRMGETVRELTAEFEAEFNPHGLGLWLEESGRGVLMAVNHRRDGHYVEIFDYAAGRLVHRRSTAAAVMHSPNDVLPVGRDSFYVTNDHGSPSPARRLLEDYLQLNRSYLLYFDGNDFRKAAEDLAYANGVNISPDGRRLYVAETVGKRIRVFNRDLNTGRLAPAGVIEAGTGVDNIEVGPSGDLWIGAHPKLLTFIQYSKNPDRVSPSQVLKISSPGREASITEVYLGDGRKLSGSSVAAVFEKKLLIGSVFDDKFLICDLD